MYKPTRVAGNFGSAFGGLFDDPVCVGSGDGGCYSISLSLD